MLDVREMSCMMWWPACSGLVWSYAKSGLVKFYSYEYGVYLHTVIRCLNNLSSVREYYIMTTYKGKKKSCLTIKSVEDML